MSDTQSESGIYEIHVQGHLADEWLAWFDGMTVTRDAKGDTRLVGPVVDQAALHGLLKKVRDLALPLVAVVRVGDINPSSV